MRRLFATILAFGVFAGSSSPVLALNRFANYGCPISVYDFLARNKTIYVATSGGLYINDSGSVSLLTDPTIFPDLQLNCLARDSSGTLWVGSQKGFLTQIDKSGNARCSQSYNAAGWDIKDIIVSGEYLLIASSRGLSIYSPRRQQAIRNATHFGDLKSSAVYVCAIFGDSLFLGCEGGIAAVRATGPWIDSLNFYDHSIWNTRPSSRPIVSFVQQGNSLQALDAPALHFQEKLVYADSTRIMRNGALVAALPSRILSIGTDGKTCWFGTEEHYFYWWNGSGVPLQVKISGLTFRIVNAILADPQGQVWCLPKVNRTTAVWWQGIMYFNGSDFWFVNNLFTIAGFGNYIGGDEDWRGICRSRNGTMYFGSSGGNVKAYEAGKGWREYWVSGHDAGGGPFSLCPFGGCSWGKCDAIAQDSSGYLWLGSWENYFGSLICYDQTVADPKPANFRRFLPQTSPYYIDDIISLCVDRSGRIFAGGKKGQLCVITHDGNPLQNGIVVERFLGDLSVVNDMACYKSDTTWIASGKGLFRYIGSRADTALVTKVPQNVICVDVESDGIVWAGTSGNGLLRYDAAKDEVTYVTTTDGLISNTVNDISIDRKRGYLWAGTSEGISRFNLMHTDQEIQEPQNIAMYPNPFSLSRPRHTTITIEKVPAGSRVGIYTIAGMLVDEPQPLVQHPLGWTYSWKPSKKVIPGTYLAVVGKNSNSAVSKLIIIP